MARQISERARAHRADGGQAPDHVVLARDHQLALLHSLRQGAAVERRAAAARTAGHQGAGYPQLCAAWGITRQSAARSGPTPFPPAPTSPNRPCQSSTPAAPPPSSTSPTPMACGCSPP
ncbi:hypothetical protein [Streptomyces sp. NPDC048606]|uniref:hypothetical protein n=1 Tax=Streptomyces sp. NPDC048606 TaxID=3154726 RepID=UPI00344231A7